MPQQRKKPNSPDSEYERLKKLWYKKLKDSGFEDVETDEDRLKVWSSTLFGKSKGLVQNGGWQAKASYYQMTSDFLIDNRFETEIDKVIWEYHSHGISVRDITSTLRKAKVKTNRQYVWEIINRLQTKMKQRYMKDNYGK